MHPKVCWDGDIPVFLPADYLEQVGCENPELLKDNLYDYHWCWCKQSLTRRSNQYKYERIFKVPGAPVHFCFGFSNYYPGSTEFSYLPNAHQGDLSDNKGQPKNNNTVFDSF